MGDPKLFESQVKLSRPLAKFNISEKFSTVRLTASLINTIFGSTGSSHLTVKLILPDIS